MFEKLFGKRRSQPPPSDVPIELTSIGGPPELGFLFIDVAAEDVRRALDSWKWIGLDGLTAIAISAFGEIFFRAEDGSIQHLDMIEWRLLKAGASLASFTADLQDTDRRDELTCSPDCYQSEVESGSFMMVG